jgi:hypothetical protein
MLWSDEAKDYGFVLTDDGERLYVDRAGSSTALLRSVAVRGDRCS